MLISPEETKAYRTISYVVGKDNDTIPNFPVEVSYIPAIDKRIKLAVEINNLISKANKTKSTMSWYEKAAEEMDIEMDDTLKDEQKSHRQNTANKAKIEQLRQNLDKLLNKSIVPEGVTPSYITRIQFESLNNSEIQHNAISDFKSNPNSKLSLRLKATKDKKKRDKKSRKRK